MPLNNQTKRTEFFIDFSYEAKRVQSGLVFNSSWWKIRWVHVFSKDIAQKKQMASSKIWN